MKKNLQRFGASVLAAAMVAQSVALPAAAETTKIDSSVAQSVAASAASAASAVQSLPKFTSTADLIKQTAQTLAAQGEVHELEQDDAKLEATAQSKAGMSLAALENALADAMYANAAAGKINTEAYAAALPLPPPRIRRTAKACMITSPSSACGMTSFSAIPACAS